MDWHLTVAIVAATATCLASVGAVIFAGGKFAGRVEAAVKKIESVERTIEAVQGLISTVGMLQELLQHHIQSDHRELSRRVDDTRDIAVSARAASQHDIGG